MTLRFRVVGPSGQRIAAGSVTVPAFSFRLLSIREVLQRAGAADALADAGGLATFYGLSQNGTVVPLSMTRNDATGAIAVDHTLPPLYYVNKWSSDLRKQGNARLAELMFAEVPEEVTIG